MATEKSSLEAQKPWFGVFRFFELSIFGAALYFLLALASVLVGHTTGGPHWKFYGVFGVALHSLPFAFAALFLFLSPGDHPGDQSLSLDLLSFVGR